MQDEQITLDQAEEAVKRGERARILFEMLLSEIGASFENTHAEVWKKLKENQDKYNESIKVLSTIIKERARHHLEEVGVS